MNLRILNVSHSTVLWGAEQALLRLSPLLVQRGFVPVLASPLGPLADSWCALGFEHRPLEVVDHHGLRRTDGSGRRPRIDALAREALVVGRSFRSIDCTAGNADVLHSQSMRAHLEVALVGRRRSRPTVLQQHDIVLPGAGRSVLTAAALASSHMIAITDAVAGCVHPRGRHRVSVISYGLDLDRFRPAPAHAAVRAALTAYPEAPLIGIVGRVDPRKNVDVLVEAVARIPEHRATVAVVGGSHLATEHYRAELEARAAQRLGDRIRFIGPRRDIPDVLRALDILVNASAAEPFGLSLLEAQACGTAVVATRSGGATEFVRHGETGLVVPPGDAESLAGALAILIEDNALRARLAASARRQAVERFDRERQADQVGELYLRLARSRSRRRAMR